MSNDKLTEEDLVYIRALRARGFAVSVFTPKECGYADINDVEDAMVAGGWDEIKRAHQRNAGGEIKDGFVTYTLPEFWCTALLYGDESGMSEEDIAELNRWLTDIAPGNCVGHGEEVEWNQWHDAIGYVLACDCRQFTFQYLGDAP